MTRAPTLNRGPHATPVLYDSPVSHATGGKLGEHLHSVYSALAQAQVSQDGELQKKFVAQLTLKLTTVQRAFAAGAYTSDTLTARRDVWSLQAALHKAHYPGIKQAAGVFTEFVSHQDKLRVEDLTGAFAYVSVTEVKAPVVQEVLAIAQYSPSRQAQAMARQLLQPQGRRATVKQDTKAPLDASQALHQSSALSGVRVGQSGVLTAGPKPDLPPVMAATQQRLAAPLQNQKVRLMPALQATFSVRELQSPPNFKASRVDCVHGATYYVSNTQRQGSFGKHRRCIGEDGQRYSIKELRLDAARKPGNNPRTGRPYTAVTPLQELANEVSMIKLMGTHMKLIDMFEIDGKVSLVLTDMAGNLEQAMPLVARAHRRVAVWSMASQVGAEALRLHRGGRMHADLKVGNILLNFAGQSTMIDFGKGCELDEKGFSIFQEMGTYPSAEMMMRKPIGPAADVHALGVAILMSLRLNLGRLFEYKSRETEMLTNMVAFANFRRKLINEKTGALDLSRLNPHDGAFGALFSFANAADPIGTPFVLSRMLDPNPLTRATMADVVTFFDSAIAQVPVQHDNATKALIHVGLAIDDSAVVQALQDVRRSDMALLR